MRTILAAILVAGLSTGSPFAIPRAFAGKATDFAQCKKQLMARSDNAFCACMKVEGIEKPGAIVDNKVYRMGGMAEWGQQKQIVPDALVPQLQLSSIWSLTNRTPSAHAPGSINNEASLQPASPSRPETLVPVAGQIDSLDNVRKDAQEIPSTGRDLSTVPSLGLNVNYVNELVTVRDEHGQPVDDLPWWRFRVYEDGVRQRIVFFTTDAYPLSVAFVIDTALPSDIMRRVNESLAAVTGAFTASDSAAVITYGGKPQLITGFTGAEGTRFPRALEMAKKPGQPMGVPITGGPFADLGPILNGWQVDPVLSRGNTTGFISIAREAHPLNDAILYAAEQLARQPRGRRRVIYVISDGSNVRSKASYKEVVQYLLTNKISVYGTEVSDASLWGVGYLNKLRLPLLSSGNILPRYASATGGVVHAGLSENGIQNSFAKSMDSVRTIYTLGYISHQPTTSGGFRTIEVQVEGRTGLDVKARADYSPQLPVASSEFNRKIGASEAQARIFPSDR